MRFRLSGDAEWIEARAQDLSAGGIGLAVPAELIVGDTVEILRFTLPAEENDEETTVEVGAQIVRSAAGGDEELPVIAGLRFLDLAPDHQERVSRFVFRRLRAATDGTEGPAKRIPFTKPIAIRFELFKDFVNEVSANLSTSGMFIHTARPRPVGSVFDFRFEMGEDFTIIEGSGEVIWVRDKRKGPEHPPGMGVRFVSLDSASKNVIRRMVADYIHSGFTPFDLEAEMAPDLPLGDAETSVEVEEERAEPADLEEVASLEPMGGLAGIAAEVDREARGDQLERELTSAVAERDQLGRRLRATRDEKEALERELAAISAEVQQSQSGFHGRVAELTASLRTAIDKEQALAARAEELEQAAAAREQERDELAGRLAQLESETEELRQGAAAATSVAELEEKVANLKASREATEGALASARREVEALQEQLAGHDDKSAALETRVEALAKERDDLAGQLDEARREAETAEQRIEQQRAEIGAELTVAQEEGQALLARIAELENRSANTSTESLQLRSRVGHLEKENELQRRELAAELAAREAQTEKSDRATAEVEKLRQTLTDLEAELERRQQELDAERSESQSLLARNDETEAEIGELRMLVSELEKHGLQRLEELDEQVGQHASLIDQTETARQEIDRLGSRVAELERETADAAELRAQAEKLRGESEELATRARAAETEAEELRQRIERLEQESAQRQEEWENERVRRDDDAEQTLAALRRDIEERDAQIEEGAAQLAAEVARSRELGTEHETAQREIADLGARLEAVEAARGELDDQRSRAEEESRELRQRLEELEERHHELGREAAAATDRAAASAARLGDLENELVASRDSRGPEFVAEAVPAPPVEEPRGGVRPFQIAAGLLIGAMALLGWQRLGLPLPGSEAEADAARPRTADSQTQVPAGGIGPAGASIPADGPRPSSSEIDPPGPVGTSDGAVTVLPADPSTAPTAAPGLATTAPAAAGVPDPSALEDAVRGWAAAWSAQDVEAYLAAYAPEFAPEGEIGRDGWEEQRRDRVTRPASLEIEVGPMTLEAVSAERFRVTFSQSYTSPTYQDEVVKTLEMVWADGAWKIAREISQAPR